MWCVCGGERVKGSLSVSNGVVKWKCDRWFSSFRINTNMRFTTVESVTTDN